MALVRTAHWVTRELEGFLKERASAPFAWGKNDCALFAADAIEAFTGKDIAGEFRGKYSDRESAFAAIKSVAGGDTVADAAAWCAAKHGLEEYANPLFAQRGDLVVMKVATDDGTLAAGIVARAMTPSVAIVGARGLVWVPLSRESLVRAWKV